MGRMVFVISNGVMNNTGFLVEEIGRVGDPVLICTDGAAERMKELGRVPDLIVGDMDSVDEGTLEYFEAKGSRIIRHPADKNETDTQPEGDTRIRSPRGEDRPRPGECLPPRDVREAGRRYEDSGQGVRTFCCRPVMRDRRQGRGYGIPPPPLIGCKGNNARGVRIPPLRRGDGDREAVRYQQSPDRNAGDDNGRGGLSTG